MEAIPRVAGYEYEYEFSIKEELVSKYNHKLIHQRHNLIIEIRTSFIINTINGGDELNDSELLNTVINRHDGDYYLFDRMIISRLKEYWMTNNEIFKFGTDATDFAKRARRVIVPLFVDFKVRTVQQNGEPVFAARQRALRAENLFPYFETLYPFYLDSDLVGFLRVLKRTRVRDIDGGLAMISICGICSRGPFIGCEVSVVSTCGHALHSHCYARWLLNGNRLCPSCSSLAYDPNWNYGDVYWYAHEYV